MKIKIYATEISGKKYAEIWTFVRLFSFPEIVENMWLTSGNFQKGKQENLVEWKAPLLPLVIDHNEHLKALTNLDYSFFNIQW